MKKPIKIGIFGGMGANASAHFFQLLINQINQNKIPMPEIFLDSVAIDDFINDDSKINPALKVLQNRVRVFNSLKINMAVMTCNTAHILHPHMLPDSNFYFPSLIDLVAKNIKKSNLKKIGLLATSNTIKHNLYQNHLQKSKIKIYYPHSSLQTILETNIRKIIDSSNKLDKKLLIKEINNFIKNNQLEGLILGCTELPLLLSKIKYHPSVTIFDSLSILSDSVIKFIEC